MTEARVSGASVAAVGRKHGINANLIFAWMKQEDQGVLGGRRAAATPKLLAVTIAPEPTVQVPTPVGRTGAGHVEISLPDGLCLRIVGAVPTEQILSVRSFAITILRLAWQRSRGVTPQPGSTWLLARLRLNRSQEQKLVGA